MTSIVNQFLKELGAGTNVKDYRHASKIFIDDNYRLSPKYSWLFHVAFDLANTQLDRDQVLEMGMLVKRVDLPRYTIDTKTYNAYNRVNVVQTKIKYDPITIVFHDDGANVIRSFWYDYMSMYYRDTDYAEPLYHQSHKYDIRQAQDWGYQVPPERYNFSGQPERMINAIRLYSLHQKKFTEYILINPTITQFQHGSHVNGEQGTLEHTMTVAYETVLYGYGYIVPGQNTNFATLHYDFTPSPLTPEGGGTQSILGPGGLLNAASSITNNLGQGNLLGAGFTAFKAFNNFKGSNLGAMAGLELSQIGKDVLTGYNPNNRLQIPSLGGAASLGLVGAAIGSGQFGLSGAAGAASLLGGQLGGPVGPTGATAISAVAATAAVKMTQATPTSGQFYGGSDNRVLVSNGEYIATGGYVPATATPVPPYAYNNGSYSVTDLATGEIRTTDQFGITNITDSSGTLLRQYNRNGTVYVQRDPLTGNYINSPLSQPSVRAQQAYAGPNTNINNNTGQLIPSNQGIVR